MPTPQMPGGPSPIQNNRLEILQKQTSSQPALQRPGGLDPAKRIGALRPLAENAKEEFTHELLTGLMPSSASRGLEGPTVLNHPNGSSNKMDKPDKPALEDSSIFGGKQELKRSELREKLKGVEGYRASVKAGLSMGKAEREHLEKEVFSSTYGLNISKSDVQRGEKQLNKKIFSTPDPDARNKIRKEIKFLKKLEGK